MAKTADAPAARATGIAIKPIDPTPVIDDALDAHAGGHDGVHRITERIENRGKLVRDRRIELPNVVLGHRDVLGERSVAVDADDLDALADVRLARPAQAST